MPAQEFFGVAPWVVVTAAATWIGQALIYRKQWRKEQNDHVVQIEAHRDELTFELLTSARNEVSAARKEMEGLREEVRSLRSLEQHFYHFQQSLEHLEAILHAKTNEERAVAERNAHAFLNRMKRLQEAKSLNAPQEP